MTEQSQDDRQFNIQRIYTKDLSFESPNSPEIFTVEWKPSINVNLGTATKRLSDDHYEVVLTVTVTATQDDNTSFLAEVQQAGIFQIANIPDDEMGPMMGIFCPNILFPYAREVVTDLISRGSFPQFVLAPVNFEAIYLQQQAQKQGEKH